MEYLGRVSGPFDPLLLLAPFMLTAANSVLYSTSYTAGIEQMSEEFGASQTVTTLGMTFYLLGLAFGSIVMAPLSEMYGRKPIACTSLFLFVIFIIPCGLAKNIETLLVVRFVSALFGSAMVATAPGQVADISTDERRALAISIWSIGPLNGPGMSVLLISDLNN